LKAVNSFSLPLSFCKTRHALSLSESESIRILVKRLILTGNDRVLEWAKGFEPSTSTLARLQQIWFRKQMTEKQQLPKIFVK